jgi:hypothetical protein
VTLDLTPRAWYTITPDDAVSLNLHRDLHITAPLNEMGEPCPWPWEPQQLVGHPLGQYHCGYCGGMVMAGLPHPDYKEAPAPVNKAQSEGEQGHGIG